MKASFMQWSLSGDWIYSCWKAGPLDAQRGGSIIVTIYQFSSPSPLRWLFPHRERSQTQSSTDKEEMFMLWEENKGGQWGTRTSSWDSLRCSTGCLPLFLLCHNQKSCHGHGMWIVIFNIKDQVSPKGIYKRL